MTRRETYLYIVFFSKRRDSDRSTEIGRDGDRKRRDNDRVPVKILSFEIIVL